MDKRGRDVADSWTHRVAISEWETVCDQLEEFCEGGEFAAEDGRATCEFANASLAVTRDGTVEAGMPLHAFEREGIETLLFHHERGELTVETGQQGSRLRYTFRRP